MFVENYAVCDNNRVTFEKEHSWNDHLTKKYVDHEPSKYQEYIDFCNGHSFAGWMRIGSMYESAYLSMNVLGDAIIYDFLEESHEEDINQEYLNDNQGIELWSPCELNQINCIVEKIKINYNKLQLKRIL